MSSSGQSHTQDHRKPTTSKRKPNVNSKPPRKVSKSYRQRKVESSRFGIVYDIEGPRVRLGFAWFVVACLTIWAGLWPFALLIASVAALAAAQISTQLRTRWRRPNRVVVAAFGGMLPLSAAVNPKLFGAVTIVFAIASVVAELGRPTAAASPLLSASAMVRSWLNVGLAGATWVALYQIDIGAAFCLLLLISAYEVGDFLVGSGAGNPIEGPAAGLLALAVVAAALLVVEPAPFEGNSLLVFAMGAGLAAPLGQVVASAILPRAGADARALRRLDSYLVAAPVWLVLFWAGLHTAGVA